MKNEFVKFDNKRTTYVAVDTEFECFKKGYSLAQETIKAKDAEIERLKSTFAGYENFQMEKQLKQELQKTREQLSESNELLIDLKDIFQDKIFLLNINDSCFSRIRRWNNDSQKYIDKYFKDKQGEE